MALQVVASKCEESPNRFTESVKEVTNTLDDSVNSLLKHTISEMFKTVSSDCPNVLNHKVSAVYHLVLREIPYKSSEWKRKLLYLSQKVTHYAHK